MRLNSERTRVDLPWLVLYNLSSIYLLQLAFWPPISFSNKTYERINVGRWQDKHFGKRIGWMNQSPTISLRARFRVLFFCHLDASHYRLTPFEMMSHLFEGFHKAYRRSVTSATSQANRHSMAEILHISLSFHGSCQGTNS